PRGGRLMLARCLMSGTLALICVVLAAAGAVGRATQDGAGQAGDGGSLAKVLSDKALWGKDFPKALSSLPTWDAAGETTIEILPDQIVSRPPAAGGTHAELAARVSAAMKQEQPRPKAAYAELLKGAVPAAAAALRTERVESFKDDQKPRIV